MAKMTVEGSKKQLRVEYRGLHIWNRFGGGVHYTITLFRNPHDGIIDNYLGPYINDGHV